MFILKLLPGLPNLLSSCPLPLAYLLISLPLVVLRIESSAFCLLDRVLSLVYIPSPQFFPFSLLDRAVPERTVYTLKHRAISPALVLFTFVAVR